MSSPRSESASVGRSLKLRHHAKPEKFLVGWREWVSLPDLGVERIKAKLDTGARTSAIHAFGIECFRRDGRDFVRFALHPVQRHRFPEVFCEAPLVDARTVTSSSGQKERRYVIETRLGIGGAEWPIEMTLTNRDEMGFRMLLGRQALRRRLIVDPGGSFKLTRKKRKKKLGPSDEDRSSGPQSESLLPSKVG